MKTFPIILIPPALKKVKNEVPSVPIFTEEQPLKPGIAPKKLKKEVIAIEGTIAAIPTGVLISQGAPIPGFLLFLAAAGAITVQVWRQIKSYPQRQKRYYQEVLTYQNNLMVYDERKQEHEQILKESLSPEGVAKYQRERLKTLLNQTSPPDGDNSKATRGCSEEEFFEHLNFYFPNKILIGKTVTIPNYSYPYTPDFIYVNLSLNLYIDLEIDEPYTWREGKPTHYLESEKDDKRNNFFLARNWLVIRFAEEQVVSSPQSCCKIVAQNIAAILDTPSILSPFSRIPDLEPVERWSENEARIMANNQYRRNYL